mmetsp:Transcript_75293/g.143269  ORF Transcript_75293/g.143269 Transcript_75293/m.143269 type:complete len:246 (-) Transcript_75293:24-761(-)
MSMMFCKKMGSKYKVKRLDQHTECEPPESCFVPMPRWGRTITLGDSKAWKEASGQLQQNIGDLLKFQAESKASADSSPPADHNPSGPKSHCKQFAQGLAEGAHADPKLQRARSLAQAGHGLSGYTTVMVQQIPFKISQKQFMEEIHKDGFQGKYDFLYLPPNARSHGSRGFGFINFLSPGFAEEFYGRYFGQALKHFKATSPLVIMPADVQGFEQSAECYFSSWHLRKTKRKSHTVPAFLKAVPF